LPRQRNRRSSQGGGAATHAGVGYQDRVAAWFAVRILDEQNASPLWNLATTITFEQLRSETTEPVDDIQITTSANGYIFIQAKHSLSLGTTEGSELASCFDQFVQQFHRGAEASFPGGTRRQLAPEKDRLVIATSPRSPETVRLILPTMLQKLREVSPGQTSDAAAFSAEEQRALEVVKNHIERSWKRHIGELPSNSDVLYLLSFVWVQTLDVDDDGNDELWAKDALRHSVLHDPTQADAAWNTLLASIASSATRHSGANRTGLQQVLLLARIELQAPRSYRQAISRFQGHTQHTLAMLSSVSEIQVGSETVKIIRSSTETVRTAVELGSFVVIGLPGAGKSVTLYTVVKSLSDEGRDVLFFSAEDPDCADLNVQMAIDALEHWPGSRPGFLVIDALDAARFSSSEQVLRTLIVRALAMGSESRWRVIVAMRKFDLAHDDQMHRLFAGSPLVETFQDSDFAHVRHIEIPALSSEEQAQTAAQSSLLAGLLSQASSALHDLLRIPFNVRLVGELLSRGVQASELTPIRKQIQLLELYWSYRIIRRDGQRDAREAVLRHACEGMVSSSAFRVDRAQLSEASASYALDDLLSAHILVAWRFSPHGAPDDSILTFSHRVLFDYSVARLLLGGGPENLIGHLVHPGNLVIAIRPSFVYRFQQLWLRDTTFFWEVVFRTQLHNRIPAIGKLIGPAVAAELAMRFDDFEPLLTTLNSTPSDRHDAAEQILRHVIGALVAGQQRPVPGDGAGPWCELVEHLSRSMQGSVIFSVRVLLSYLVEHPEAYTTDQLRLTGVAARHLLEFAWNQQVPGPEYARFALEAVCRTYESDPVASRTLLRRSLTPEHLAAYGYFELFTLAHEIKRLIPIDSEFVRDTYTAAFSYEETSQETTHIGNSQILSLLSTRSQDYASALYQLAQVYSDFLNEAPADALLALISIMDHGYSSHQGEDEIFDFNGVKAHMKVSRRGFRISRGLALHPGELGQMLNAFRLYLEGIADDAQQTKVRQVLLHILAKKNSHAMVWRSLLMVGAALPSMLRKEIRSLAWGIPILLCAETMDAACDFLSSVFSDLTVNEREKVEQAILTIPTVLTDNERTTGKHIQNHLLRCLAHNALVTEEAKRLSEQLHSGDEAPPNEPLAVSGATWGDAASESEEPNHRLRQQIRAFTQAYMQGSPTSQEIEDIFPVLLFLREALSTDKAQEADPSQHFIVWSDVVEACVRITGWNQFSCETETGKFVLSVLLEAAEDPLPIPNSDGDDNFDESPSWGKPAPRIDAAAGLTRLTRLETCIIRAVLEAVFRLSLDTVPAVRFQVLGDIGNLYHTMPDLMWMILEHAALNESSRGVLQSVLHTLGWLAGSHPDRITELVKTIYERTNSEAGAGKVRKACVLIFAGLYLYQDHPVSREMIFSIIDKPVELHDENWQIMAAARDVLTLGSVTPSDDRQDAVRKRGWYVMLRATKSIHDALQRLQSQQDNTDQSKDRQEHVRNLYQLAESVAADLYFASEASDQTHNSEEVTEEHRRFFTEAGLLFDELSNFRHPGLVHYLVKMLAFLIPVNPARVFTRIGQIVLSGRGGGYQFEPSAIDLIVRIMERYLAEFRDVLREDESCLQLLIEMLDGFVEVGWPSARRLAYRLEEIFY
jgi:hypothetical protein